MSLLLKTIRVFGYRGLKNIEINLERVTVLTGMNNTGKTSLLKALQLVLGTRQYVSPEDFFISDNAPVKQIVIDIKIIFADKDGNQQATFDDKWEEVFKTEKIRLDGDNAYIPVRNIISFDIVKNDYKIRKYILQNWPAFKDSNGLEWHASSNGKEQSFYYEELPFFYMDAQRDIVDDIRTRTSFLGRMIAQINYSASDIEKIEKQIKELNESAVNSSDILLNIKNTLAELNSAMDARGDGVEITPFTKKIRDLNKGVSINYADSIDSFPMEYHGMGTRSWSSILTLKSFITMLEKKAQENDNPFFPILALEEPEAHLHPNAQKKLYNQLISISGQIIISTHSAYIAASAKICQLRSFFKNTDDLKCGKIETQLLTPEDVRKIQRQVLNTRGEIFFSKCLVFFEGETEEQALPILANHFFKQPAFELGIDFIGVGGYGNYLPFLRLAEALNIPWFIFSDAEPDIITSVNQQFAKSSSKQNHDASVIFVTNDNNFESELFNNGYKEECIEAIKMIELPSCKTERHKEAKENEISSYTDADVLKYLKGNKTQFASVIADSIIKSGKPLPNKIVDLFNGIKSYIKTS